MVLPDSGVRCPYCGAETLRCLGCEDAAAERQARQWQHDRRLVMRRLRAQAVYSREIAPYLALGERARVLITDVIAGCFLVGVEDSV